MESVRDSEALSRLRAAVEGGADQQFEAWAATGAEGLAVLRDVLVGAEKPRWEDVHPRDAIDNLSTAVSIIAARHPEQFLETFLDSRFDGDSYVLTGLGQIDDERATDRLVRAALSEDQWIRMRAAIGLARRASPMATGALVKLIADPVYLVRYHALRALAAIGDHTAMAALHTLTAPTEFERDLAEEAIRAITSRTETES